MTVRAVLGVDLGTTAVKVMLLDIDGHNLGVASREYELQTPDALTVEVDADTYWEAFKAAVAEVTHKSGIDADSIEALAMSAQGETILAVDGSGVALRPAIVWADNRPQAEAAELAAFFTNEVTYRVTGQVSIVPAWPAAKVLWLSRHEPDVFARTAKFLLLEDYFIGRLTGRYVCEGSLTTSTVYWDINTRQWWPEMLDYLGISTDQLPEILESGEPVGPIIAGVADELGLSARTIVCTGALDQAAGAIGVGNIRPGIFSEATGAALAICATVDRPTLDPKAQMPCHYHGLPGLYMEHTWTTGGLVLRWFRDAFCQSDVVEARRLGVDPYELLSDLAEEVPPGCDGLVMLPHLQGAMAPEANPDAKGVFYGFTIHHGKAHFIRAIMESIACALRRNVEVIEGLGIRVDEIRVLGGGSRSRAWNQIKADLTGRPVILTGSEEAACLGAAILAGSAVGMFASVGEAVERLVVLTERFEPSVQRRAAYDDTYARYGRLYADLLGMFELGSRAVPAQ